MDIGLRFRALLFSAVFALMLGVAVPLVAVVADDDAAVPLVANGTNFAYQGRLVVDGIPADGDFDFQFTLLASADGSGPIGTPIAQTLSVDNGSFTTMLDFGAGAFPGDARWIAVQARPAGAGAYTALGLPQLLAPAPYALTALSMAPNLTAPQSWTLANAQQGLKVTNTGPGVTAISTNDIALIGEGSTYGGIFGTSQMGIGVKGTSSTGYGVQAISQGLGPTGAALYTQNTGGGIGLWSEASTSDAAVVVRNAGNGDLLKMFDTNYTVRFRVASNGYTEARAVTLSGLSGIGPATVNIAQPDQFRNLIYAAVGGATRFTVSGAGNVSAKGTYFANQFDLAEHVSTTGVEPGAGDVVEVDPGATDQFRLAATPNSALVAGVISTAPGIVLGSGSIENPSTSPQLALAGRVPVKVSAENGPIRPGDLLVASSTPGHAMKAPSEPAAGTVVGKALDTLDAGTGTVMMLVMLR